MHSSHHTWATRYSLIERIRDNTDETAWDDFVKNYKPFIHYLLNTMEIHISEQDDMIQEILVRLHQNISHYAQERGRFRPWLSTVIKNTANTYLSRQSRQHEKDDELKRSLQIIESYSQSDFDEMISEEWKQYVADQALERLASAFSENVVECFKMTMKGISADKIAEKLQIKRESVYIIRTRMKDRVMRKMQELIRELEF